MKVRRRDAKLIKATIAKDKALRISRLKKVRIAREVIHRKMNEAGLPRPSKRKMKTLVARTLSATGDPPRTTSRVSLGQGMQRIVNRTREQRDKMAEE